MRSYAHKDQAETGVLFELIARRYEYRSIAIAANQPFSGWDQIFPDKAMTVAAIDRLCPSRDLPRNERRKLPPTHRSRQQNGAGSGVANNHQRQPNRRSNLNQTPQTTPTPSASRPAKVVVAPGQIG